jgi:hypothetical protein
VPQQQKFSKSEILPMISSLKKQHANRFVVCIGLIALTSCSEPRQENPFELVKNHVWGDKVNSCDYQKIAFHNNSLVQKNSKEMIAKVKQKNPTIAIEENEIFKADKIEKNKDNFRLHFSETGNIYTYVLLGDTLKLVSTGKNADEKIKRQNDVYPTDFVICE